MCAQFHALIARTFALVAILYSLAFLEVEVLVFKSICLLVIQFSQEFRMSQDCACSLHNDPHFALLLAFRQLAQVCIKPLPHLRRGHRRTVSKQYPAEIIGSHWYFNKA